MFTVEMSKNTARVIRRVTLPKAGPFKKPWSREDSFSVDRTLAIDAGEPPAREIHGEFLELYRARLKTIGEKGLARYERVWTEAAEEIHRSLGDLRALRQLSDQLYDDLDDIWSGFREAGARDAGQEGLEAAVAKAIKAGRLERSRSMAKVKVWDARNDKKREDLWSFLLKVTAGGVVAGPTGVGIAVLTDGLKGYGALRDILLKRSSDAEKNVRDIKDGLETATKAWPPGPPGRWAASASTSTRPGQGRRSCDRMSPGSPR